MKLERWRQVERLYHAALEREESERGAFLDEACSGDPGLRDEVGSLRISPIGREPETTFTSCMRRTSRP